MADLSRMKRAVLQLNLKQHAELTCVNASVTFILNANSRYYPLLFVKGKNAIKLKMNKFGVCLH